MSISVPLYGFGASGGTGDELTVVTPGAGISVTVEKDGKAKTKISSADGTAVFRGLESGEWTVTMTDGSQTATKTATVTTEYSVELTFFAATIHVTYPAGSTCTATDGVTTMTAPDTSGAWEFVVSNAGAWTVSYAGYLYSDLCTVDITASGQTENVTLILASYIFKAGYGYQKDITYNVRPENVSVTDDKITIDSSSGIAFGSANTIDISKYGGMKIEYAASKVANSSNSTYAGAMVLSNTTAPNSSQSGDTSLFPYKKALKVTERTVIDLPFSASGNYYPFLVGCIVGEVYNWWLY